MSLMLNTGAMQYKADGSSGWQPLTLVANVDLESLADEFSTSSTYEVGEYVRRGGIMYRCITAVTTAGAWDSTKWVEVNIGDELERVYGELKASIPVAPYKKKKYILTGDSYMGIGTGLGQQIVDITGIDAIIFTEGGGGGFVGKGGQYTFLEGLQEIVNRMPVATRDETCNSITDIYIFGGWNDYSIASADILTAMGTFDAYAKTRFPNALVTLAVVAYASRVRPGGATDLALIEQNVITTYSYGSSEYGWGYIPYANSPIHYPDAIGSDGTHPITTEEIAKYVSRYITSGSAYYNSRLVNALVPYNNTVSSGGMTLDTAMVDGQCTIINRTLAGFVFSSPFSFSGDLTPANRTVIGTYNGFAQGIEENGTPTIAIPLRIRGVWINDTAFHDCDGILWISYGYIYLSLMVPTEVGVGSFTSSSFGIPPFSFTIPSDLC